MARDAIRTGPIREPPLRQRMAMPRSRQARCVGKPPSIVHPRNPSSFCLRLIGTMDMMGECKGAVHGLLLKPVRQNADRGQVHQIR